MYRQSMTAYGAPLEATEAPTPEPKGTEVLIRVSHCGVCHSDIHIHDGHFSLGEGKELDIRQGRALPFTLGHEIAGIVEAVGAEAEGVAPGERYAVYPWIGCGTCPRCLSGEEHLCGSDRNLGITVDGGYATHVLVPHPRYLIPVEGLPPERAGSFMCSGLTAYSAIRKALPYLRGGPLLIVGMGGVGMMAFQLARAVTEAPIAVADIDPRKREAATAMGAVHAFDSAAPDARKTALKTMGPAAAAIDFVGSADSLNFAQGALGTGGAVIVVGLMGGRFSIPVPMFPLRQLAVIGSLVGSLAEAREVMGLARNAKVGAIPIATRPLKEANAALDDLRAGRVLGRVVLTP